MGVEEDLASWVGHMRRDRASCIDMDATENDHHRKMPLVDLQEVKPLIDIFPGISSPFLLTFQEEVKGD